MTDRIDAEAPGLRERKKLKVRHNIERVALSRVLADGYDAVTVDAICREAEVSKKTFFNYFSSKEAALLGERQTACSPQSLSQRLEEHGSTPYLETVAEFIGEALYPRSDDAEIMHLRSRVLSEIPQLAFRSRKDMVCVNRATSGTIHDYLDAHPERRIMPEQSIETEIVLATSTALNIARSRYLLVMCCDREGCSLLEARDLLRDFIGRAGSPR